MVCPPQTSLAEETVRWMVSAPRANDIVVVAVWGSTAASASDEFHFARRLPRALRLARNEQLYTVRGERGR